MTVAQTDLRAHERFLSQAERYRYGLVQQLNQLQADAVSLADDTAKDAGADQRKRIDVAHWHRIPVFAFEPSATAQLLHAGRASLALLAGWLLLSLCLVTVAARRMGVAR